MAGKHLDNGSLLTYPPPQPLNPDPIGMDRDSQLIVYLEKVEEVNTVAELEYDTLELVQDILGNCRRLCRQMGQCSKGYDLCGKHRDPGPVSLDAFCQACDTSMMKSRLEQAVRLVEIGQYVAELIHDIKRPAAAISTAAQTLQRLPDVEGTAHRLATIIREEINHLNKLVDGLLYVIRPKQPKFIAYDVNEIVNRIMPVIKGKIGDKGNNVAVKWEPAKNQAVALVDDDQIEEVFMNLATNALEAMIDGGTLSISVKVNKNTIKTAFTDTGLGISERDLNLIFNPFYSTKMEGIGLGLVTVKRVAEIHNGCVDVTSHALTGTTLTVTLPRLAKRTRKSSVPTL